MARSYGLGFRAGSLRFRSLGLRAASLRLKVGGRKPKHGFSKLANLW